MLRLRRRIRVPGSHLFLDQLPEFLQARQPRGRVELEDERVAVSIQHQPGPAVALAVDQAVAGGLRVEPLRAARDGRAQEIAPPRGIDRRRLADVQHPHAQRRLGVEQAHREKAVLRVVDHRQFAGGAVAVLLAHAVREHPRMPTAQMTLGRRADAQSQPGLGLIHWIHHAWHAENCAREEH